MMRCKCGYVPPSAEKARQHELHCRYHGRAGIAEDGLVKVEPDYMPPGSMSSWGMYDDIAKQNNMPRAATSEYWQRVFGRDVIAASRPMKILGGHFLYGIEQTFKMETKIVGGRKMPTGDFIKSPAMQMQPSAEKIWGRETYVMKPLPAADPSATRDRDHKHAPVITPKRFDPFADFLVTKGAVKHDEYNPPKVAKHPLQRTLDNPSPFGQSMWKNPLDYS